MKTSEPLFQNVSHTHVFENCTAKSKSPWMLCDSSPSMASIKNWFNEFQHVNDCPFTTTTHRLSPLPSPRPNYSEMGYELPPLPQYSPYLAPCDFFSFQNLKKSLAGQKFESNKEVIDRSDYPRTS